jgi:hypothetical protein
MSTPANADRPMRSIRQKLLFLVVLVSLPPWAWLSTPAFMRSGTPCATPNWRLAASAAIWPSGSSTSPPGAAFLATLARLPAVRRLDARACEPLFRELLAANPFTATWCSRIWRRCAGLGKRGAFPVNLRDSAYFGRVLSSRFFAVGGYRKSRTTGYDVLVCGHPVFGQDGALAGVVSTGLKLDVFEEASRGISLPPGSTVFMVDHAGLRLFNRHFPNPRPELYPRVSP